MPEAAPDVQPARREPMIKWFVLSALVALLAVSAALVIRNWDYIHFRYYCHQYRQGNCAHAISNLRVGYQDRRDEAFFHGLTEQQMIGLLGQPRVILGEDEDGYASVPRCLEIQGLQPNGSEKILWYGDNPPYHSPRDESFNVYFYLRDNRVIICGALCP